MKTGKFIMILLSLTFLCLAQNSFAGEVITQEVLEKQILTSTDFVKTADNFIILFDSSSSMNKKIPGTEKTYVVAAKQILQERNANFPDLDYNAGLYLYTPFKPVYMVQRYERDKFAKAIEELPETGSGPTLMQWGVHNVRKIIAGLTGKTIVFMFTDGTATVTGEHKGSDESVDVIGKKPVEIAREIAAEHDVSFILISTATGSAAKRINEAVASVNASSRVIPFEMLYKRPEYMPGILFDIIETSRVKITPRQEVIGFAADDVLFDFNSDEIAMGNLKNLDQLAVFLNQKSSAFVIVDGYTDSIGGDEYNLGLSKKRSLAVADYMLRQHGLDESRVLLHWYGKLNPTANNSTEEGRSLNRRAEISVGGI